MAVKEKRVVQEVLVCDYCDNTINEGTATKFEGKTSGYMKRDSFEIDLCESCASTMGLKRRGRRPGAPIKAEAKPKVATANGEAPKKRGRPKKVVIDDAPAERAEVTAEDWG